MLYTQSLKATEAFQYLSQEKLAVLSTIASDGTTDSSAIFFLVDDKFNFYFTTKIGTRKYENLSSRPQVSLTIANGEAFKTIEVKGVATLVTDATEITQKITDLIHHNGEAGVPWAPPIAKIFAGQFAVIKITPSWLRYGVFKNEEPVGQYFAQIIPDVPSEHAGLN